MRDRSLGICLRARSCSQIRITRQPHLRRSRFTRWSRALFPLIFFFQNARLLAGILKCFGQPCQKHPSTKMAIFCFENEKSGLPKIEICLRQPVILFCRNRRASAISVSLFPRPRIRDITSERFALVKTSAISASPARQRTFPRVSAISSSQVLGAYEVDPMLARHSWQQGRDVCWEPTPCRCKLPIPRWCGRRW